MSQTAGIGHNNGGELTSDQRRCLAGIYRREHTPLSDQKKAADKALKDWGKRLKADLGEHGAEQVKIMIASETEEGAQKVDAKIKAMGEARRWASHSDNQLGLFPEKDKNGETKAYNAGKLSGLDGEPLHNPYGAGTSDHDDFARGHQDGSSVMDEVLGILKSREEAEAEEQDQDELVKGGADLDDEEGV